MTKISNWKKGYKKLAGLYEKESYTLKELGESIEIESNQLQRLSQRNEKNKADFTEKERSSSKKNESARKKTRKKLFLKCGTVDMYDMMVYDRRELTLHHEPPFRYTHHTIFSESYLLTRKNHTMIEKLQRSDYEAYKDAMKIIRANKKQLIREKKQRFNNHK